MEIRSVRLLFPCVCLSCVRVWRALPADWAQEGRGSANKWPSSDCSRPLECAECEGCESLGDQKQFRLLLGPPPLGERRENRSLLSGARCWRGAVRGTSGTAFTSPVRALVLLLEGVFVCNGERNAVKVTEICSLCCSVLLRFLLRFQYAH